MPEESTFNPWHALVYRVADGEHVWTELGPTADHAERLARKYVEGLSHKQDGRTFYVFDDGTDAPAPESHSVKA